MSKIRMHKDLDVWKESMRLAKEVYVLTERFPKEEMYGLTSQMRRSAVSIPSNIAEGAGRNSNKEFVQFLYISLGSLAELETQILLSKDFGLLQGDVVEKSIERIRRMLLGLIDHVKGHRMQA